MSASIPQSARMSPNTLQTVKPLFLKDKDIGEGVTPIQVCEAVVRDVNPSNVESVQKIHKRSFTYFNLQLFEATASYFHD